MKALENDIVGGIGGQRKYVNRRLHKKIKNNEMSERVSDLINGEMEWKRICLQTLNEVKIEVESLLEYRKRR